ncbi:hypothetical protein GCM10011495_37990 [Hymenobacter frigidus]|uniref:Transposase n=1 Tax=Hymenobacter frigidus TaxID=1524095 RepID=A0ABQ2AFH3_9BACT|nr:hypothetical protein GCM10011495_37990 [Hymenobacter frigidus]
MAKWRDRTTVEEAVRGPKPASTVLTPAEEAAIILFRQQTLLPLDDCLYALQEAIPNLSPLGAAPLPATPRHQPPATGRRGGANQKSAV